MKQSLLISKDEFIDKIYEEQHYDREVIGSMVDVIMTSLIDCFKEGKTVDFGEEFPRIKVKKSISKLNEDSPRTAQNDRILVQMRIPLETKNGVKNK